MNATIGTSDLPRDLFMAYGPTHPLRQQFEAVVADQGDIWAATLDDVRTESFEDGRTEAPDVKELEACIAELEAEAAELRSRAAKALWARYDLKRAIGQTMTKAEMHKRLCSILEALPA